MSLLLMALGACGKAERATTASVVDKPPAENKTLAATPSIPNKPLSVDEAMGRLFEVDAGEDGPRYIWKNIAAVPDLEKNRSVPLEDDGNGEVWALGIKELADGHTVLVTGLTPLLGGNPETCHACSASASVFFFVRAEQGEWKLAATALRVLDYGSGGGYPGCIGAGTFSFVELGVGRSGFLIDSGGSWQGRAISAIEIAEFTQDNKVVVRTKQGGILSSGSHVCGMDGEPESNCYEIGSRWQLMPGEAGAAFDFRMDFEGYTGDSS